MPDGVIVAEKMDAAAFGRHLRLMAAMKRYELGHLSSGGRGRTGRLEPCRLLGPITGDMSRTFIGAAPIGSWTRTG